MQFWGDGRISRIVAHAILCVLQNGLGSGVRVMYSIEIINEYMAGKEAVSEKSPSLIHSLSARSRISAESRMSGAQMRLKETLLQKMRLHSFSVMVQRQGSILISVQRMIPTESLSSDRSRDQLPLLACSQVSPRTQIHRDRWGYPPVSMSPDSSQQVFVLLPYSLFHGRGEDVHREMNQAVVWVTGQTILKQCITYHISCIYYHQSLSEAHNNENSSI